MLRPFKSFEEFEENTCHTIGDEIQLKRKGADNVFLRGIISGYYYEDNIVSIGFTCLSFKDLCKDLLFLDITGIWREFGVEEPEKTEEKKKPAKFKVGKKYYYIDGGCKKTVFINAKYKDPEDNQLTAVVDDCVVRAVFADQNGNEVFKYCGDNVRAENEVKE